MQYIPRTPPLRHQAEILERSVDQPVFAFLMEPGTGKSWLVIQTLGHWWTRSPLRGALIIAPNGVHENWLDEIAKHMGETVEVRTLAYDSRQRLACTVTLDSWVEELGRLRSSSAQIGPLWIVTMNVEALSTPNGEEFAKGFLSRVQREPFTTVRL